MVSLTMSQKKTDRLTILGAPIKGFPASPDEAKLETFDNSYSKRNYWITLECEEFTSLCPKTGQPDFGKITIKYIPNKKCIETKSLKLYFFSFRNAGIFVEDTVNKILDKIVKTAKPRETIVKGNFNARGGITISVEASYKERRINKDII